LPVEASEEANKRSDQNRAGADRGARATSSVRAKYS
jgi:hypothetical protein